MPDFYFILMHTLYKTFLLKIDCHPTVSFVSCFESKDTTRNCSKCNKSFLLTSFNCHFCYCNINFENDQSWLILLGWDSNKLCKYADIASFFFFHRAAMLSFELEAAVKHKKNEHNTVFWLYEVFQLIT